MIGERLYRYKDAGLLVLRVAVGLDYMFLHGWGKLMSGPDSWERYGSSMGRFGIDFLHAFWGFMAALAETLFALFFAAGFLFVPACFMLGFTMLVAFTGDVARRGLSGGSHAGKMLFVFASMGLIGPGRYSVDHWLLRRRKSESEDA